MTKGVVLFAHNNDDIDYVEMAKFSASRIKKYLDLPVTLITDRATDVTNLNQIFDQILFVDVPTNYKKFFYDGIDFSKKLSWKNTSRQSVYELTPYDETLVLDTDFILCSSVLKNCWNQSCDFLIYKNSYDLSGWRNDREFRLVSEYSIYFQWATVFWFRKNAKVELFFNILGHIKENWNYYKTLYQIHSTNFRNDYAFSIALHTINGFVDSDFAGELPGKMFYTLDLDFLEKIDQDKMLFLVQKENANTELIAVKTQGIDVHVMNKYSLMKAIQNV